MRTISTVPLAMMNSGTTNAVRMGLENFKYKTFMTSLQQENIVLKNDINDEKKNPPDQKKLAVLILNIFNFNIQQHEKLRECSFVEVKTKHSR